MQTATLAEVDAAIAAFDWSKIDSLTDEQLEQAAATDPDNPDTSKTPPENWQRFYPVPDLKVLRRRLKMSAREFSLTYRIAKPILERWEQGRRSSPGGDLLLQGAVSVYLALIAAYPKEMARMIEGLDRDHSIKAEAAE